MVKFCMVKAFPKYWTGVWNVVYMSMITNMVKVRNSEVISDKFNIKSVLT
jgi:hypothetical protein